MTPDLTDVLAGIAEARRGAVAYTPANVIEMLLDELWSPKEEGVDPQFQFSTRGPVLKEAYDPSVDETEKPARRPPPWFVGMSQNFKKDIGKVDMKIRGRILEAVSQMTENPLRPHGDTVKPLSGKLAGCWRYRVGDYRLVYSPDRNTGNVTLLAFASRGSIYD